MNPELINTFLKVTYCRNITQAANQLYVSQSTVSSRLRQLEEELGVVLIERSKGIRSIELTNKGRMFLPIAERYAQLNQEINQFNLQEESLSLTIASTDSLNLYILRPLYEFLITSLPHVNLRISTHQSPEIYTIVENYTADVGFVFHQSRYPNIMAEAVLREKMILMVCEEGGWHEGPIHPMELDPAFEVYMAWSEEIVRWHDYWWPANQHSYAQVDTASLLVRFMTNAHCWALCPVSVAKAFASWSGIAFHECAERIPDRICYMLTRRNTLDSEVIRHFRMQFLTFLKELDMDFTYLV